MWNPFRASDAVGASAARWIRERADLLHRRIARSRDDLVLPVRDHFRSLEDAEDAEELVAGYAAITRELMGIPPFTYRLEPHATGDQLNQDLLALTGAAQATDPGGTYSTEDDGVPLITWNPILLDRPVDLVTTLAHEISHHVLRRTFADDLGEEEELLTDLCVVRCGLGLFQLRSSLRMESWTDGLQSGWSVSRSGYLSMYESAYALAVCAERNAWSADLIENHLTDLHYKAFRLARRQAAREAAAAAGR